MTRWEGLFADLEAQAGALAAAELGAEVGERSRGEQAQVRLVDRLRPALGQPLQVTVLGGLSVHGLLARVGSDWLLLADDAAREVLVPLSAVVAVVGVPRWSAVPGGEGAVAARLGIGSVLRAVARDRLPLRVHLADGGVLDGTLDRVGADVLEFATHRPGEFRRRGDVHDVVLVPTSALAAVRRERPAGRD